MRSPLTLLFGDKQTQFPPPLLVKHLLESFQSLAALHCKRPSDPQKPRGAALPAFAASLTTPRQVGALSPTPSTTASRGSFPCIPHRGQPGPGLHPPHPSPLTRLPKLHRPHGRRHLGVRGQPEAARGAHVTLPALPWRPRPLPGASHSTGMAEVCGDDISLFFPHKAYRARPLQPRDSGVVLNNIQCPANYHASGCLRSSGPLLHYKVALFAL